MYSMPPIELGAPVLWYPEGRQTPLPGTVVTIGSTNITIAVWVPESRVPVLRDSVVHASDPRRNSQEVRSEGCWDYCNWWKRFGELAARVDALERPQDRKKAG